MRVGSLGTPVVIRLWRDTSTGWLRVQPSHLLMTPLMAEPSMPGPSGYGDDDVHDAMRTIVAGLRTRYEAAVAAG